MAKPIWQGNISFGLVSIPITLHSAEKRSELHFHLLDSRNKGRIHYERINDITGEEVPWNEIVKAYEYHKDKFVILKDEDFSKAAIESSQTIEIENFVDGKEIDPVYFERPYYLVPDKKGVKGYVLLREVLKRTKKVGIAKVVIRTRQYLTALMVVKNALVLNLLRFSNELRKPEELPIPKGILKNYKITGKEFNIAEQLVNAMASAWKPNLYHDEYRDALLKLISKKEKGIPIKAKPTAKKESAQIIDFMSLLKKSIEEKKRKPAAKPHRKKRHG